MAKQKIVKFRARSGKVYDVIEQILGGFVERLNYLTRKHLHVSVSHMTIRLPIQAETNGAEAIGTAVTILRQELKKKNMASQAGWVREIKDGREHFHLGFMWVPSCIQSAITIGKRLDEILHEILNLQENQILVNVNFPLYPNFQNELNIRSNYTIKIRRDADGFENQKNNIIDWLAYLAKTETKGSHEEKHIREFGFSLYKKTEE